jgi:Inactive homolog of metal-dependent proteases, putative molecular chaperone
MKLYIDTSIKGLSLGLLSGDDKLSQLFIRDKKSDSQIALSVDKLLEQEKVSKKDIKLIVVSKGPGSFTGIRLGLAWVYGFVSGRPQIIVNSTSSLGMAARNLCSDSSLEEAFVLLKNTKTSGFLAKGSSKISEVSHISLADIKKLLIKKKSSKCEFFIDSTWAEACDVFLQKTNNYKIISLDTIADNAFWGMTKYCAEDSSELPLPFI